MKARPASALILVTLAAASLTVSFGSRPGMAGGSPSAPSGASRSVPPGLPVPPPVRSPGLPVSIAEGEPCVPLPQDDRCERWSATYDNPNGHSGGGRDAAQALATGGRDGRVFVTGYSWDDSTQGSDYVTVAYDWNGVQRWRNRYDGPAHGYDTPSAITVSPDEKRVFVTGWSPGSASSYDYATVAYDARNGHQLWASRYDGPGHDVDLPYAVAVAPDGSRLYVTGGSPQSTQGTEDFATIAYDAATGTELWTARYDDPGGGSDQAFALAPSRDGTRLFVTGDGGGPGGPFDVDYITASYAADSGTVQWVSTHDGGRNLFDAPLAVGESPNGRRVYVTGESQGPGSGTLSPEYEMATVGLDAATGTALWSARHSGPTAGFNAGFALAVSPVGDGVYITGLQSGQQNDQDSDFGTVAYRGASGRQLWASTYSFPGETYEWAHDVEVSRDGHRVYVAGLSGKLPVAGDYATVSYDAKTGGQRWAARYNDLPGADVCFGWSLGLGPRTRVAVTGVCYQGQAQLQTSNIVTVAY